MADSCYIGDMYNTFLRSSTDSNFIEWTFAPIGVRQFTCVNISDATLEKGPKLES